VSDFLVPYPNVLEAQLLFGFPSQPLQVTDNYIANFIFKVSNQAFQSFHKRNYSIFFLEGRGTHLNQQTYSKVLLVPDFLFLDSFIYLIYSYKAQSYKV
jgi:hypothetical protein